MTSTSFAIYEAILELSVGQLNGADKKRQTRARLQCRSRMTIPSSRPPTTQQEEQPEAAQKRCGGLWDGGKRDVADR